MIDIPCKINNLHVVKKRINELTRVVEYECHINNAIVYLSKKELLKRLKQEELKK